MKIFVSFWYRIDQVKIVFIIYYLLIKDQNVEGNKGKKKFLMEY